MAYVNGVKVTHTSRGYTTDNKHFYTNALAAYAHRRSSSGSGSSGSGPSSSGHSSSGSRSPSHAPPSHSARRIIGYHTVNGTAYPIYAGSGGSPDYSHPVPNQVAQKGGKAVQKYMSTTLPGGMGSHSSPPSSRSPSRKSVSPGSPQAQMGAYDKYYYSLLAQRQSSQKAQDLLQMLKPSPIAIQAYTQEAQAKAQKERAQAKRLNVQAQWLNQEKQRLAQAIAQYQKNPTQAQYNRLNKRIQRFNAKVQRYQKNAKNVNMMALEVQGMEQNLAPAQKSLYQTASAHNYNVFISRVTKANEQIANQPLNLFPLTTQVGKFVKSKAGKKPGVRQSVVMSLGAIPTGGAAILDLISSPMTVGGWYFGEQAAKQEIKNPVSFYQVGKTTTRRSKLGQTVSPGYVDKLIANLNNPSFSIGPAGRGAPVKMFKAVNTKGEIVYGIEEDVPGQFGALSETGKPIPLPRQVSNARLSGWIEGAMAGLPASLALGSVTTTALSKLPELVPTTWKSVSVGKNAFISQMPGRGTGVIATENGIKRAVLMPSPLTKEETFVVKAGKQGMKWSKLVPKKAPINIKIPTQVMAKEYYLSRVQGTSILSRGITKTGGAANIQDVMGVESISAARPIYNSQGGGLFLVTSKSNVVGLGQRGSSGMIGMAKTRYYNMLGQTWASSKGWGIAIGGKRVFGIFPKIQFVRFENFGPLKIAEAGSKFKPSVSSGGEIENLLTSARQITTFFGGNPITAVKPVQGAKLARLVPFPGQAVSGMTRASQSEVQYVSERLPGTRQAGGMQVTMPRTVSARFIPQVKMPSIPSQVSQDITKGILGIEISGSEVQLVKPRSRTRQTERIIPFTIPTVITPVVSKGVKRIPGLTATTGEANALGLGSVISQGFNLKATRITESRTLGFTKDKLSTGAGGIETSITPPPSIPTVTMSPVPPVPFIPGGAPFLPFGAYRFNFHVRGMRVKRKKEKVEAIPMYSVFKFLSTGRMYAKPTKQNVVKMRRFLLNIMAPQPSFKSKPKKSKSKSKKKGKSKPNKSGKKNKKGILDIFSPGEPGKWRW